MFSSSRNDYEKWKTIYANCVYVDGNLEINNFHPFYNESVDQDYETDDDLRLDAEFDFSFLDSIKEITGYLLVHNTRIKNLRFKNLQLIRGKNLISDKHSIYIDSNVRLENLDLSNLKEIQRGSVLIRNNPALCNMNDVAWNDLILTKTSSSKSTNHQAYYIDYNDNNECTSCKSSCCSIDQQACGCWGKGMCQNLTKIVCNSRCEGRCYGPGQYDCCNTECLGGCFGPNKNDCFACKNLRIVDTGECVDTCPRIQRVDPLTSDLVYNPNGLYQYGITCVKSCPHNTFVYNELCLTKCPSQTYEEEELILIPETGEKGLQRICKPCTPEKCPKTCFIEKIDKKEELTARNLKSLESCEILNSNLLILQPDKEHHFSNLPPELTEQDLEVLSSIRIINGFVRIQSNQIKSLKFLRNLEIIRATNLVISRYSMIIHSKSLKTLDLFKLKQIEKGDVILKTDSLCLSNTIDWEAIINRKNSFILNQNESKVVECMREGYVCDSACKGCWSTGSKACQFCKTYKLDEICVEKCEGNFINDRYTYLENNNTRECKYCHQECLEGCTGPVRFVPYFILVS